MKRKFDSIRRAAAWGLAVLVCIQLLLPAFAAGTTETLSIQTVEELVEFSTHCALDTWSRNKTVVLATDLSLEGIEFAPIPTFGGTFDGNGHTISGLSVSGKYAPAGLFGTLQSTAVVKNLTVRGAVAPDGTREQVGGLVGLNQGTIENCTFVGVVSGKNSVGGIAGLNDTTGSIRACTVEGSVLGKSMTGGLVGKNLGSISGGENHAQVNGVSVDPGISLSDLDLNLSTDLFTLRTLDTFNVATDTGGIAGYSSGMVLNCSNFGAIGYQHVGYNVGGILGRSCGHVYSCTNEGPVLGRKDIGGIVGQAEPYIVLNLSEDMLRRIRGELDQLQSLAERAADDAESSSNNLSDQLSAIVSSIGTAADQAETLTDLVSDYGDSTITEINRGADLIKDSVDRLLDLSGDVTDLSKELSHCLDTLYEGIDEIVTASSFGTEAIRDLQEAAEDLAKANTRFQSGMEEVEDGLASIRSALQVEDWSAVEKGLDSIDNGLTKLLQATETASDALDSFSSALKSQPPDWSGMVSALQEAKNANDLLVSGLKKIQSGLRSLKKNISFDLGSLRSGLWEIDTGVDILKDVPKRLGQAGEHMQDSLKDMESASLSLTLACQKLADSMAEFETISEHGTAALTKVEELFDHLASADPLQIAHPSEEMGDSVDSLFRTMEQLNAQFEALNGEANTTSHLLTGDLRSIGNQFQTAMNTVLDAIDDLENRSTEDILSDTSEENIDAVTNGKILSCVNHAEISGDINTGGIAGSMAVEYELDPEDDLLSNDSALYRREYEMKAIVQKCVNTGAVCGRRNDVGAICGRMDLGLIIRCEGYGSVQSEQADYVGGIVGFTAGTVRNCFAKCRLFGRDYVGGIAGAAADSTRNRGGVVAQCYAFVSIDESEQYAGAVSGSTAGTFRNNFFVSDTLAGLDRVSIADSAEPMTYDQLLQVKDLPDPFRQLSLRFWAEETLVQEETVSYGDSIEEARFPAIPKVDGSFGRWDKTELNDLHFDTDVTALYTEYHSVLASKEQREDGRAVFLVEGQFQDGDRLSTRLEEVEETEGASLLHSSAAYRRTLSEVWQLGGLTDGLTTHTLRYLPANTTRGGLELYEKQDGQWHKLETTRSGSYWLAEVSGSSVELVVVTRTAIWWLWCVAAGLGLLLLVGIRLVKARKQQRKEKQTHQSIQSKAKDTEQRIKK